LISGLQHPFSRGKAIKTQFGNYTPDFDCGKFFLEVKSLHSWLQALGAVSLLENAKKEEFSKLTNNSQMKMEWANTNVKPVYVYVELSENSNKFKGIEEPIHQLIVVKGSHPNLQSFLIEKFVK
jgi:hypothetical protein